MNFKAYYDVNTDTIKGCNPFSYAWFHETRHQKQFQTIKPLKVFNQQLEVLTYGACSGFLLGWLLGLTSIGWTLILMGSAVAPYSFLNMLLELDAIVFGSWNWYRHHKTSSSNYK